MSDDLIFKDVDGTHYAVHRELSPAQRVDLHRIVAEIQAARSLPLDQMIHKSTLFGCLIRLFIPDLPRERSESMKICEYHATIKWLRSVVSEAALERAVWTESA